MRVKKNLSAILLSILCTLPLGSMAYANEVVGSNLNKEITNEQNIEDNKEERLVAWSIWAPKSKTASGTSYDNWVFGTEGRGGTGVNLSFSKSVSVSNSL